MSISHRVSLHLSRNNSFGESTKEKCDTRVQEPTKYADSVARTKESFNNIKEMLGKTTEKYRRGKEGEDLLYYEETIKKLQHEKKELMKKLKDGERESEDSNCEEVINSCKELFVCAKEQNFKEVEEVLGNFGEFSELVKFSNLTEALLRSIRLCKTLLPKKSAPAPKFHISKFVEEDISELLKETTALSSKINRQKTRVNEICKKLENSIEKSKTYIDSFEALSISNLSLSQ